MVHITPLLKNHIDIYFLFMKLIPIIIFLITILMLYSFFNIHKNKKVIWPISILRILLPLFCVGFYGQIFVFFSTLFDCQNGKMYVSTKLNCRTGNNFLFHSVFVFIAMFFLFIISLITNSLYYKSLFNPCKSDVLKKTNSLPDVSLLLTKTIIILLFVLDKGTESEHWAFLFVLMLISGINAYINLLFKNRLNALLMLLNIILSLILFFGYFTLFIGKILKFLKFNGSIYLFVFWIIYIFAFFLFLKNKEIKFNLLDYKTINNANEYINYILKYYRLILCKNNSRNNMTILKSYIEAMEETCINSDCPLKIYLSNLEKGNESEFFLYQYIDVLFKYGISKFKDNAMLKNSYAFFLESKMNNKAQAMTIINSINEEFLSFNRNYNIFRCKRVIHKHLLNKTGLNFDYKTNINNFTEIISNLTKLYFQFWSLLYDAKFQHKDNFKKLYEIGSKIMKLNKKVENVYQSLIKTKTTNIEIFKLYYEFLRDILKNEQKLESYQNSNSIYNESFENEVKDYSNYNMDNYKKNDLMTYLLISGRKKDLGIVLDCSLSASKFFGYTKDEVIGKSLNIFIPDIFHLKHNSILSREAKNNNIKLFNDLFDKKEYNPNIIENYFFAVFKSKFIQLLKLKIFFVKTEDNITAFIVQVLKGIPYMNELIINKIVNNSNVDSRCCILTNENFLINSFTPNCLEQLGLSYRYIKSSNSIIPFIKQLYEDYINAINELGTNNINFHSSMHNEFVSMEDSPRLSEIEVNTKINISSEIKNKIKEDLVNKKYHKRSQITWRLNKKIYQYNKKIKGNEIINETSDVQCSRISHRDSKYNITSIKKNDEKRFESEFLMEIKKAIIDNKLLGYYFYFSRLFPSETKNFISYRVKDDLDDNEENQKRIKYKTIIKPIQKYNIINKEKRISNSDIDKAIYNSRRKSSEISKNSDICNSYITKRIKIKENLEKRSSIQSIPDISDINGLSQIFKNNSNFSSENVQNEINSEEVIIDENFIPNCNNNFSFDLNKMCYNFEKATLNSKLLTSSLHKEAKEKIKVYQEYLTSLNKEDESDLSESNSEDVYSSSINSEDSSNSNTDKESSSNVISNKRNLSIKENKKNFYMHKSITLKNEIKAKIDEIPPIKQSNTSKINKKENEKNDNKSKFKPVLTTNSNISQQMKKYHNINDFYKVNLSKIHYLVYDFNKEMFIEGNKKDISIKVESIIINYKKQTSFIDIGKDEKYPFIHLNNNKDIIKNINKNSKKDKIDIAHNNKINEEKSLIRRFKDAISSKKDEKELTTFKIYMIISFFIMLVLAIIIFILNLYFFNKFRDILSLLKYIINIKHCQAFSIYCVRELTLINFNVSNLEGGVYTNFPGKDREAYRTLIREKLVQYFLENQNSLKNILSTKYSHSKIFNKNISETIIESVFDFGSIEKNDIKANLLSTLMQYNSIFYSISSFYSSLHQNHSDMMPFFYNSLNNFKRAILIIRDNYNEELYVQKYRIIIYFILNTGISLIIYFLFNFLLVSSFISAAKKRIVYIQVFYGIKIDIIKDIALNCEKLINKLKKIVNKDIEEEDNEEETDEIKSFLKKKNKNEINPINKDITNSYENKNSIKLSVNIKLFIFIYIFLNVVIYSFIPYKSYILYNLCNKTINYSNFILKFNDFNTNILEFFNAYREYLFDNTSFIEGITPLEYLIKKENEIYEKLTVNLKEIETFINATIIIDDEISRLFTSELCSYCITDYFNSLDECRNKFGNILNFDFNIFTTNFIQRIVYTKNIVKYKYETELIYGNLNLYEVKKWSSWNNSYFGEEDNENTINKKKSFKLEFFNNETLHSDMNLIFINIFLPILDGRRKAIINRININRERKIFIVLFIEYLIVLFLIYFIFLFPMIRYINNFIYKTKNMILLIPMTILSSQSNIKSLLKIT